ncbi:hypothetical protein PAI11_09160 [Patulibacter medicamentivorans]|uniref:Uncharacterized protein n=2 Tax=Patulibacter medicamentivorans TaxID=1097667 RepID=H0E2A3_9ACTN|nr:hypothetical protein PAI11_09160 [Patulibacter medicamentivorans]
MVRRATVAILALASSAIVGGPPMVASAATAPVVVPASAAGPPAAIAWRSGRTVSVGAADGGARRPVARLASDRSTQLSLSADGRRLALAAGDRVWVVDLVSGTPARDLRLAVRFATALQWSPDGQRIAVVDERAVRVCEVGPSPTCARWARGPATEMGASWSPDGRRLAYVRKSATRAERRRGWGALVVGDGAAAQVVERFGEGDRSLTMPMPPIFGRAGLTWTSVDLRMRFGEMDGLARVRTRRLEAGGVRTLSTARPRSSYSVVVGEQADGSLLLLRQRLHATTTGYRIDRLDPTGAATSLGIAIGTFGGQEDVRVLGALTDGRVAISVRRSSRSRTTRLHLATPGRGLGGRVAGGDEVAVAAALPGNAGGL